MHRFFSVVSLRALCCASLLTSTPSSVLAAAPPDSNAAATINAQTNDDLIFGPLFYEQAQQADDNSPTGQTHKQSAQQDQPPPTQSESLSSESKPLPAIEHQPLGTPQTPTQQSSKPRAQMLVIAQTLGALILVISLALGLRAFIRTVSKRSGSVAGQLSAGGRAPAGVLSILGRYPVARGQTLVLLKLDRRILLLCQTQAGFTTLSDIDDPDEVASILTRTQDAQGASMTKKFRDALHIAEQDPAVSGNGTLELPDDAFTLNTQPMPLEDARTRIAMDPVESLKRRLEQLGGTSA